MGMCAFAGHCRVVVGSFNFMLASSNFAHSRVLLILLLVFI